MYRLIETVFLEELKKSESFALRTIQKLVLEKKWEIKKGVVSCYKIHGQIFHSIAKIRYIVNFFDVFKIK